MRTRASLLATLCCSWSLAASAYELEISNVRLEPEGSGWMIVFDIGWQDSWRTVLDPEDHAVESWDAAWVFAKFIVDLQGERIGCEVPEDLDYAADQLDAGVVPEVLADRDELKDGTPEVVTVEPGRKWVIRVASDQDVTEEWSQRQASTRSVLKIVSGGDAATKGLAVEKSAEDGKPCLAIFERSVGSGDWQTARIARDGHRQPTDGVVEGAGDERGAFVYRQAKSCEDGAGLSRDAGCFGPIELQDVGLHWLPDPGVSYQAATIIDLWVMAIEMVHVPEGRFWIGDKLCTDTGADSRCFYDVDTSKKHFEVDGEAGFGICNSSAGGLCWGGRSASRTVPDAFPKGYQAFYMMKYELNQGQFADFLNTQKLEHRTLRFPYGGQDAYRYQTMWDRGASQLRLALRPERANNWVSWSDVAAFLDWAALRPMTELEFEKAARGLEKPVAGEYAWGTANIYPAFLILGAEDGNVVVSGNSHMTSMSEQENFLVGGDEGFGPLTGNAFVPLRDVHAGSFEPPNRVTLSGRGQPLEVNEREDEGRSFYGAFQLTGNLWEYAIHLNTQNGRAFTGCHGDGQLDSSSGLANVEGWPGEDGVGAGFRGGAWFTTPDRGRVADRHFSDAVYPFRSHDTGIRGARTAPGGEPKAEDCQ